MLGVSFGKADEKQRANMDPFGRVTARAAAEAEAGARNVAIWCLAGGGLALAGTAVLYFVTRPGPTAPVKAGAAVGPKGPSLWIEGQF